MAFKGKAKTYDCVCDAIKVLHDKTDLVFGMLALGDCGDLLNSDSKMILNTVAEMDTGHRWYPPL